MSTPTKKQKEIYDYVKKYIEKKDYSPTFEEIKKHFRLKALSGVHQHIDALVKKGMLIKNEHSVRGIELNEKEEMVQVPLLGTIAAGRPIEAIRERETIAVPRTRLSQVGDFYALRVKGNSMIDENIDDGDMVIVKEQSSADDGQKVVALIDNNEVTLKKIYKEKNKIRLQPANLQMEPIFIEPERLTIQGMVIDVIKNFSLNMPRLVTEESVRINNRQREKERVLKKWINTVQCMDCVKAMKQLPDDSIDLIVTSPPYDRVRDYNGFNYDLHTTGEQIYRVLKEGGMAIMVIQDQTKNFGKTLTSFKTIIDWCDNIGFKLFETVIYKKHGAEGAWWTKRFRVDHEYIPIFLKGKRPQFFDKEHLKIPSKHAGKTMTGCATRLTNGKTLKSKKVKINPLKCRGTIWDYVTCGDGSRLKHEHPATFPDKIPRDFIRCFCPENGIVLDPFIGSGTTALAAIEFERNYIGFDISKDYCDLTEKRIKEEPNKTKKLL